MLNFIRFAEGLFRIGVAARREGVLSSFKLLLSGRVKSSFCLLRDACSSDELSSKNQSACERKTTEIYLKDRPKVDTHSGRNYVTTSCDIHLDNASVPM